MDGLATRAAADRLQISIRRVQALITSGQLEAHQIGGRHFVSARSIERYAQITKGTGRPWSAGTAWAALALLSNDRPDWIAASQLSRLRHRMRGLSPFEFQYLTQRRAVVNRYLTPTGGHVRLGDALMRTGTAALDDPDLARRFGLAHMPDTAVDGYLAAADLDSFVAALHLEPDLDGNATLRTVDAGTAAFHAEHPPLAAVAVDLMDSLDTRTRTAGSTMLKELLDGQ